MAAIAARNSAYPIAAQMTASTPLNAVSMSAEPSSSTSSFTSALVSA
jgi:hypothetical protein